MMTDGAQRLGGVSLQRQVGVGVHADPTHTRPPAQGLR